MLKIISEKVNKGMISVENNICTIKKFTYT